MMNISILGSGSGGNSCVIKIKDKTILIDVGFSYKQIKEKMEQANTYPKDVDYILITHDHSDHIYGLNVFLNNNKPTLYISERIKNKLNLNYEKTEDLTDEIIIDDIFIKSIPTSHDATDSTGFLIEVGEESLVYITDTGYLKERYLPFIKNKTYYIFESNHDAEMLINGTYPPHTQRRIWGPNGHLSNEFSGKYLSSLIGENTKKIVLAHISRENNTPEIALETVKSILFEHDIKFENIVCASQFEITKVS